MLALKIFLSSTDKIDNRIAYEHIVLKARDFGISGATVYRGVMGYGSSSSIHSSAFWELTEKLPIVIEIIDSKEKINNFYFSIQKSLEAMPKGCLAITYEADIKLYKPGKIKSQ